MNVGDDIKWMVLPMSPQEERWAEALEIHRQHGDGAPLWIAERIGALVVAGDQAGIDRFKAIALHLDALLHGETH